MIKLLAFILAAAAIACDGPAPPKLRQWYPIDRCNDYADSLNDEANCECVGCVGTKCDVSVTSDWTHRVEIIKLDCSGRKCLAR